MLLENKVFYRDQDITFILVTKIEHTVSIIAERKAINFDEAYELFISSATHKALRTPESLLWTESSEYIADIFEDE
jgi:hypothetical protein